MQPDNKQIKILLVEDNDVDVEMVRRLIKRHSLDVPIVRARNGVEALDILSCPEQDGLLQPYIILLDINMPMMSGFELLEHMEEHGPRPDVPIYILSSSDAESDQQLSQRYQISGYLVKPLTPVALSQIVDINRAA